MATFVKAQMASLTATLVDFTMTIVLKEAFQCWYLLASVLGTISGGVINFTMNRRWVFRARSKKVQLQAIKYIMVWMGNLLLVSAGVFLLTNYAGFSYVVSKVTVSLVVGVFYNYVLQKRFVFK
ncbi:MAG: GtrA family protein [Bacteroidetes bacterium]|nr:GtrA family protein [Bacteroidota bacterium]